MEFKTQHNGKGKTHLLDKEFNAICGRKDAGDFSPIENLVIENGKYYIKNLTFENSRILVEREHLECEYCIKCLNKIEKYVK